MKAFTPASSKGPLWYAVLAVAAMFQGQVCAEPEPDGEPAHAITVDYFAGAETGNGYALKDARATQYVARNGEPYVRIDYTVANTSNADLQAHAWRVGIEGQTIAGITTLKIGKGASMRFSKMIYGKRVGATQQPPIAKIALSSPANSAQPNPYFCPNNLRTLAQCETERAARDAGSCARSCMIREGSGGQMTPCVATTAKYGYVTCTSYHTRCECSHSFGIVEPPTPELDALFGEPGRGGDPAPWYVKDLPR